MKKRIDETWTGRGCLNLSTLSFLLSFVSVYEEHLYSYEHSKMTPNSYAKVSDIRCPPLTITIAQILKTPE
jgi:hypothetical protein